MIAAHSARLLGGAGVALHEGGAQMKGHTLRP